MRHIVAGLLTFVLLCASAVAGRLIRSRLPEEHRTRETTETVTLMIGMLVTFAALVLGLLTASVKASYDTADRDRHAYALQLTQLDRCLRDYGPAAEPARAAIHAYTAAVIASTWPDEPPPAGVAYPDTRNMPRVGADPQLAELIEQVGDAIRRLTPVGAYQERLDADCHGFYRDVLAARIAVINDTTKALSTPFVRILVFWLMVIFGAVGLAAPTNKLALAAILLCAFSLSSAIFVISDLSQPYGGFFSIASTDMRTALTLMQAR